MQKIWVINHNAQPPSLGGLCRHYYFKKYADKNKFDIKIITSSVIHNTKVDMLSDTNDLWGRKEVDGEEFVFLKTNKYTSNSIRRKLNFLSFAFKIRKLPRLLNEKPDLIYTSSPDIFAAFYALKLAKKLHVPCTVEIRDLWPESIIEYSDFSPKHPFIQIMYKMEKWIYKNASSIVFTTEGEKQYLIDKGLTKDVDLQKCYYINNGVDISSIEQKKADNPYVDKTLNDPEVFKCVYVGSIRRANNVGMIAEAANLLKENDRIHFLFFGDGTERAEIEEYCRKNALANCHFYGKVDAKYIPYICSAADVNVLNYQQAKTLKYGGSQNKLFDYMSSGTPIISTVKMNYNLIERAGCGITLDEHTPMAFANAIEQLSEIPSDQLAVMGASGLEMVKEYDYSVLTERFLYVVEKTLNGTSERQYKIYEGEKNNG